MPSASSAAPTTSATRAIRCARAADCCRRARSNTRRKRWRLHGALIAQASGTRPSPGFLASARGVQLHVLRLDDLAGELRIEATRQAGGEQQILYTFAVSHDGRPVADGRAAVVLEHTARRDMNSTAAPPQACARHRRQRRHRPRDRRAAGARWRARHRAREPAHRRGGRDRRAAARERRQRTRRAASTSPTATRRMRRANGCSKTGRCRSSSTTPACTTTRVPRAAQVAMATRDRRVAERLLPRHAAAADADDPYALGPHRQHLVGRRDRGQPRSGQLRGREGRAQQRHQSALARGREPRHHRQRGRARHHRRRHGRGRIRPRDDRSAGADEACRHVPTRSQRWWRSSPPTTPATSAGRSFRSTEP